MRDYLAKLSTVLGAEISESDLLTVEETRLFISESTPPESQFRDMMSMERSFDFLRSPKFSQLVRRLHQASPLDVHVLFNECHICGMPPAVSLTAIRFDFEFEFIVDGIFSLQSQNRRDHIVIDWFEEVDGKRFFELTIEGDSWGDPSLGLELGFVPKRVTRRTPSRE